MKKTQRRLTLIAAAAVLATACGDDSPTEPNLSRTEVAGTYGLVALTFDPQGSLPEVDLMSRLGIANPSLQLTASGVAQLTFRDPDTNLLVTVDGTYSTTPTAVRLDFGDSEAYERLLLSQRMTFEFSSGANSTLDFEGDPGTIRRAQLLQLVPEFEDEQLLDPVPGMLEVSFRA